MDERDYRRRRRDYVRRNHPDRGGDPAAFIAGLLALDRERRDAENPPRVVVVPTRPWPQRAWHGALRIVVRRRRPRRVR